MTLLEIRGINQKANPQYDRDIDNIGRVNQITYSLINRLNAKTVSGSNAEPVRWEMVRLALGQTFDMARAISQNQPFRDLTGDLIIQPTAIFRFRADAAYNMYGLGLRSANTDLTATYRDVAVTIGSRFDDIAGANYVMAQVSAKILSNLDAHVAAGYDVRNGSSVENRVGIDWRFQCFAIAVEYVNRHDNENQVRFSISLLGVGQVGTKVGQ